MKIHRLKTLPEYFKAQILGNKQFEVRKNDRDFHVGDVLVLEEWDKQYTGTFLCVRVTYVLREFEGLKDGYVVLGTEPLTKEEIEKIKEDIENINDDELLSMYLDREYKEGK